MSHPGLNLFLDQICGDRSSVTKVGSRCQSQNREILYQAYIEMTDKEEALETESEMFQKSSTSFSIENLQYFHNGEKWLPYLLSIHRLRSECTVLE